jgi:hypothetical protein
MEQPKPITVTYPDGVTAQRVVDLVVRNKPIGWSRHSYSTYYREPYALWLKKELDKMMADKQPRAFPYNMWKNSTPNTIYLRINQAWHYLNDFLDPTGIYVKMWHETKVCRVRGYGVKIEYKETSIEMPEGEVFVPRTDVCKWKKRIDDYLNDDSVIEPLHIKNLILTPEEVKQQIDELSDLVTIHFVVKHNEIKIIKVNAN